MLIAPLASASTFETLHKFTGGVDGLYPAEGFAADSAGILYGITSNGGKTDNIHCGDGCGTIFSVDPTSGKFTSLHKFTETEGITLNSPLISGGGKIFYGAAGYGGPGVTGGGGTIFKFDAAKNAVTVLYTLTGANGALTCPVTGLALAKGGLYGSAFCGGPGNFGGVYRFDLKSGALSVVYAYNGSLGCPRCGQYPNGSLVIGKGGMLYGATNGGSNHNRGAVFRINPVSNKAEALHAFGDSDGGSVSGNFTVGADGMLYGTTSQGATTAASNCGNTGCGAVFKFDPAKLSLTILHRFTGGTDGGLPGGDTALDGTGKFLYGQATYGGAHHKGVLYKVDTTSGQLTVVHAFAGPEGAEESLGRPGLKSVNGKLIGTTGAGGIAADCKGTGCGTVFEATP